MTQLILMVIAVLVHIWSFFIKMDTKQAELTWRYMIQVVSVVVFLASLISLLASFE